MFLILILSQYLLGTFCVETHMNLVYAPLYICKMNSERLTQFANHFYLSPLIYPFPPGATIARTVCAHRARAMSSARCMYRKVVDTPLAVLRVLFPPETEAILQFEIYLFFI